MVHFNVDGLDKLGDFGDGALGGFLASLGVLAVFLIIILSIAFVFLWVFGSIGLMNLAKKNNIPNPWLVFVPIGRSYILGKLGFEIYGDKKNSNNTTFMWITFGLGIASFVLGTSDGDIGTLVKYALLFFECWAFYNIFKNLNEKNSVVYTVFTALTGTLLGGLFIYLMKEPTEEKIEEANVVDEKKEEVKEEKKETKKETKKESTASKFCTECGTKLTKEAKFCPECGKKAN